MVVTAPSDVQSASDAARKVVEVHRAVVEDLRAGLTLAEVDALVTSAMKALKCRSAFYRYRIPGHSPYPSQSCLSVNDCIVHGTHLMSQRPLEPGDLLSIDVGVVHKGWIGDAAWTYAIEHADDEALALMRCGRRSLELGLAAMQPNRPLMDWARAVQSYVENECGYWLVRGLGGHGYGRKLHGPPFISNVVPSYAGEWPDQWKQFKPGLLVAVEPMIAVGTSSIVSEPGDWPIRTADGSLSVHYEADVLITPDGPRDLTEGMADLPDVVG
ncbi:MAG: M24 family metallopeptidase [Planctomycetota bacterium]|jgi:methionyl aminopeptidase